MSVQQIMENVQQMQNVQIQMEVLVVNVILHIQEMVSIVQVLFFFFFFQILFQIILSFLQINLLIT